MQPRLFWSLGDSDSAKKLLEAGLEAAIFNALTSFSKYYENNFYNLEDDDNQPEDPRMRPSSLGLSGALAALLKPHPYKKLPQLNLLQPELFEKESGVPTLVGLVSWGLGCARPDFPGVFTDIRHYRDWIIEKIGGEPTLIYIH